MAGRGYRTSLLGSGALAALAVFLAPVPALAQAQSYELDIPAMALGDALRTFARVTRQQVVFSEDTVRGRSSSAIRGRYPAREALNRITAGTGLSIAVGSGGIFMLRPAGGSEGAPGEGEAGSAAAENGSAEGVGTPEILVVGNRSQNVDIRRTEDDPQPYVVFDSREIERSGANNLEDFFRTRMPMNTSQLANAQLGNTNLSSNVSQVDLRGLGTRQTLILVDGRRAPRVRDRTEFSQADLNGIPLSAIERIEVLPSTAGGIYGGGAVGGVINIIRKRDYNGLDLRIGYDGTFRGGGEAFRAELTGGFSPDGGRTQISFSASRSTARPLLVSDNDLTARGRVLILGNRPEFAYSVTGSTPNIFSLDGGNLVLRDGTVLTSDRTFVPAGYRGVQTDGIAPLLVNVGQYNSDFSDDIYGLQGPLRNNPRVISANLNVRRKFGEAIDVFADFTLGDNLGRSMFSSTDAYAIINAGAPTNPFQQDIFVTYPVVGLERPTTSRSQTLAATGGLVARISRDWTATVEYGWSRSRSTTRSISSAVVAGQVSNDISTGVLDVLRDLNVLPLDYSSYFANAAERIAGPYVTVQQVASGRVSGKLASLPGGPLMLTGLLEYRHDDAEQAIDRNFLYPARSQTVSSGYGELRAPILSERNGVPFIRSLELQASIRHDRYGTRVASPATGTVNPSTTFSYDRNRVESTDYTLALLWSPVRDLTFRASYATGFLPPSISQLVPQGTSTSGPGGILDPRRNNTPPGGLTTYTLVTGGNIGLQPELSRSLSLGVIVTPSFLPGFRASLDYSRIRKANEIGSITTSYLLANEDSYPGRVERGPLTDADRALGYTGGPITLLDISLTNIATARVQAYDFQLDYSFETPGAGDFHFYAIATLQTQLRRRYRPDFAAFDTVGFSDGPLRWRGNAGIDWTLGNLNVGWNIQYYDGYSVRVGSEPDGGLSQVLVIGQGAERIPSQIYNDIFVRYRLPERFLPGLSGAYLMAGIQNMFDARPPVVASLFAGYSAYGDPRLRRFTLSLTTHFGR